ncbi:MAG: LysR family transcriptional regulator [Burkholderiales bacterium]|nr:LysR family transcriptional regulator [Burkholderiales bacterium]
MNSIRGIIGFARTVAAGNFAGAARELGITPVAVSKNVQRLEQELGVRLLQRSTRKLSLTDEGRQYYDLCAGPLRELEQAQSAITEKGKAPAGTLKVTCLPPFGHNYVIPLLPAFSALYPAIEIDLHLDDAVSDMIGQGYDVGMRAGEIRDGSMIVREVAPLNFVVCAAPSYLAKYGLPVGLADLADHNCLRLGGGGRARGWFTGPDLAAAPSIAGNFVGHDIMTLVSAAVHGHGLVFAPLPLVLPLFRCGALRPVLPECVAQPARIFLHYPNRRHLPARVKVFVSFMLERLRSNADLVSDPQALLAPFLDPGPGKRAPRARRSKP